MGRGATFSTQSTCCLGRGGKVLCRIRISLSRGGLWVGDSRGVAKEAAILASGWGWGRGTLQGQPSARSESHDWAAGSKFSQWVGVTGSMGWEGGGNEKTGGRRQWAERDSSAPGARMGIRADCVYPAIPIKMAEIQSWPGPSLSRFMGAGVPLVSPQTQFQGPKASGNSTNICRMDK